MTTEQVTDAESNYDGYYSYGNPAPPCNSGNTKAFSEIFLPTLYSIVFIIGFIGNSLVVWVLVRYRQKSNLTDVCLFNLALSDLLFIVSLPFWAHVAMAEWIFGKFMCHTITGLYMLGLYGSIFFMVLMTVDRYIIIVHAHSIISRNRTVKMGLILASLVWILSLFAALPNIIFAREIYENNRTSCGYVFPNNTWKSFTYLILNILSFFLPLIIMGFCYSRIIPILLSIKTQKRHKVIKIILAVVVVYFLFWAPYNIAMFLSFLQLQSFLISCEWQNGLSMAMQLVETIAFSHCCLNPIIYAFVGEKFRRAVFKALKEQFPVCFRNCATISRELSERRSSVFTKSSEYSTTRIA